MKTTLIDLFTSKKFLAALAAVVIYVAGRFGFDVDPAALDRIFAALLVYVGAQGVADVGKGAAQVKAAADHVPPRAPAPNIIGTFTSAALVLLVVGLVGSTQLSCAEAQPRARAANGAVSGLQCEAPDILAAMPDVVRFAIEAIRVWISGDGHIDASGLAAAAKPIATDLGKCAFDAAVAALATPAPKPQPGAPAAAALAVNGAELEATWRNIRGELGWAARAAP